MGIEEIENKMKETDFEPQGRYAADSAAEFVRILTRANMTGADRLFGGDLLTWMDDVAAVSARRFARSAVTTACIERLRFLRPARQNETMVVSARVIWTGRTSMVVLVRAETEDLDGTRNEIADGYFTLVALDDEESPRPVPTLIPVSEQEKQLFDEISAQRAKKPAGK